MPLFIHQESDQQIAQRGIATFLDMLHTAAIQATLSYNPYISSTVADLIAQARTHIQRDESPEAVSQTLASALVEIQATSVRSQQTERLAQDLARQQLAEAERLQRELDTLQTSLEVQQMREAGNRFAELQQERDTLRKRLVAQQEKTDALCRQHQGRIAQLETELADYETQIVFDETVTRQQSN